MQWCSLIFGHLFPHCGLCCCVFFAYCLTHNLCAQLRSSSRRPQTLHFSKLHVFLVQNLNLIYKPAIY